MPDPRDAFDDNLDSELADALGSMSLDSLMDLDLAGGGTGTGEGVRTGRVISISGQDIFVDLGGKSQGVIGADQFASQPLPRPGDRIEFTVEGYDRNDGLLLLSRQGAVQAATWSRLADGQIVEGRVSGHNKGGLELDVDGIKAFMPISQVSFERIEAEQLSSYVSRRLKCEVVEVRRDERTIIVSHRGYLMQERDRMREQTLATLEVGQIVTGIVRTLMPYGAFVDLGGVDGLLHIGDMSFARVEKPEDVVHVGQQLELKVLKIDPDNKRISLGLKQVMPDPWTDAAGRYAPQSMVAGRVVKLMEFGAFVELEPGVEGLVPIGELSYGRRIGHPREVVNEGDVLRLCVLSIDPAARRISLSLKRVGDDPWVGASVRWREESIVEGTVTRLTDFGAFVELTPGVEGLAHISELSDKHVRRPSDVIREGQAVRAFVLEVDEDRKRISLSIKRVKEMEAAHVAETAAAEAPAKPRKKRDKPLKGGLEW